MPLHLTLKRKLGPASFLLVFEHELTHCIFAWLTFHRVTGFKEPRRTHHLLARTGQLVDHHISLFLSHGTSDLVGVFLPFFPLIWIKPLRPDSKRENYQPDSAVKIKQDLEYSLLVR